MTHLFLCSIQGYNTIGVALPAEPGIQFVDDRCHDHWPIRNQKQSNENQVPDKITDYPIATVFTWYLINWSTPLRYQLDATIWLTHFE